MNQASGIETFARDVAQEVSRETISGNLLESEPSGCAGPDVPTAFVRSKRITGNELAEEFSTHQIHSLVLITKVQQQVAGIFNNSRK
jgi:hypothetical protein